MTKNSSFFIELSWVHQLLGAPIFCSPPQATPLHLIYIKGALHLYMAERSKFVLRFLYKYPVSFSFLTY